MKKNVILSRLFVHDSVWPEPGDVRRRRHRSPVRPRPPARRCRARHRLPQQGREVRGREQQQRGVSSNDKRAVHVGRGSTGELQFAVNLHFFQVP